MTQHAAEAGRPWRELAASAYRAYAASTDGKNYQGLPMPAWDDLPRPIRIAWEAAARQVGDCLSLPPDAALPDPERWVGWTPPDADRFDLPPITTTQLHDILLLVDTDVPLDVLQSWSPLMRELAEEWAISVHLSANDHAEVTVPERPDFLPPALPARPTRAGKSALAHAGTLLPFPAHTTRSRTGETPQ